MKKIIILSLSLFLLFILADSAEAALNCSFNSCPSGGTQVLKMSASSNAHAELPSQSNYTNYVCCSGISSFSTTSGTAFLRLSAMTNAHVERGDLGNYGTVARLVPLPGETITCTYQSTCPSGYVCLASISSDTNAHIGNCSAFPNRQVCCTASTGPTFDFEISLNSPYGPSSRTVTQGLSTTADVGVILKSVTTQAVSLWASNVPSEVSVSFGTPSCNPTCSSIMTINTSGNTIPGTYDIYVGGTGGGLTPPVSIFTLTVTEAGVQIVPPSVITEQADNITQNSANLKGNLTGMGNASTCLVWFEYWIKPGALCTPKPANPTVVTLDNPFMSSPGSFSKIVSNLTSNTAYCFEAYAKNGGSW